MTDTIWYIASAPTPQKEWMRPRRSNAYKTKAEAIKCLLNRYPNTRKINVSHNRESGITNQLNFFGISDDYTRAEALELIKNS